MYLTNIKRLTKAGNCPTYRSVNICEGPIQLKVQLAEPMIPRAPENQPDNQLISIFGNLDRTRKLLVINC